MKRIILTALAFIALFIAEPAPIVGEWRTADGATVRIKQCGSGLCGLCRDGARRARKRRAQSLSSQKRGRSVLGIEVLINLQPGARRSGPARPITPEDGLLYNATVTEESAASLQIKGCGANGGVCGSETWSRVK